MNLFLDEFIELAELFYSKPLEFRAYMTEFIIYSQDKIKKQLEENNVEFDLDIPDLEEDEEQKQKKEIVIKLQIFLQFLNIPFSHSIYKKSMGELDVHNLGKIVIIQGTVIRVSKPKTLEKIKKFKCTLCGFEIEVQAEHENYGQFILPYKCRNSTLKPKKENPFFAQKFWGNKNKNNTYNNNNNNNKQPKMIEQICGGTNFEPVVNSGTYIDYQEIKIQEPFKTIKPGNIPKTIWIILESTLVDVLKPGDDILVQGIYIRRWKKLQKDARPDVSTAILGNLVQIQNNDIKKNSKNKELQNFYQEEIELFWGTQIRDIYSEIESRNLIIESICNDIYEKYDIKLAILLCIIGGVTRIEQNMRIRGQCHLLLVGEPGTGKSQLLKYATKLSSRSVFTNGIGTTSAGLTISHTKEGGEWMIEAGALVLADNGICCIDEFNLIKKHDQTSVLEAMEQQTISGQKAGTLSKLNTRATVIAACNPVTPGQKYNPQLDLQQNTGLTSPLLSRFDLIFIVTDICDFDADSENCDFILERFMKKEDRYSTRQERLQEHIWDTEKMKEYINYVRSKFEPVITESAQKLLVNYYKHLRQIEMHAKTTIRQLESLLRLCQAHARMLFRDKVEPFDAICVITLNESSYYTGILEGLNVNDYIMLDSDKYEELKAVIESRLLLDSEEQE